MLQHDALKAKLDELERLVLARLERPRGAGAGVPPFVPSEPKQATHSTGAVATFLSRLFGGRR